jgi:hypothetical protein
MMTAPRKRATMATENRTIVPRNSRSVLYPYTKPATSAAAAIPK